MEGRGALQEKIADPKSELNQHFRLLPTQGKEPTGSQVPNILLQRYAREAPRSVGKRKRVVYCRLARLTVYAVSPGVGAVLAHTVEL